MKLKTKIIITILFFVVITTISITTIVVCDINAKAKEDILQYEIDEIERVKQELVNIVDIGYDCASRSYANAQDPAFLAKYYGHRLKNIIDIAFSILSEKNKLVKDKSLTIEDAQSESIKLLKNVRYNNSGYIWINSIDWPYPKMIMHPVTPELDGKILNSKKYNCALGTNQNLFQAGVEKAVKNGDGFIDYEWSKPTKNGFIPSVQKLSYVRLFAPWKWVLGVGVFVDEAIVDAKVSSKFNIENMRYNNNAGYLFIINEKLHGIMHPYDKSLENKDLANIADPDGVKLFAEMADICKKGKSGFLEYRWEKPLKDGKTIPRARKMSYVRLFKPWGWIIGSGVYIDQIDKRMLAKETEIKTQINALIKKIITAACVIVLVAIILSMLFANTISAPILLLIKKLKEIKISDLSNSKIDLKGSYEIKELGMIFNETTKKLSEAIEKLKATTNAKEKIEAELNIARDIQMNIIPNLFPAFPDVPEFELFASIESAKAVGGDLYDFFMIDEATLCFAIGDVSGKGVPASLFMAITHTLLRAKTVSNLHPNEIIQEMNTILCKDNNSCMFVTFVLFILNIKTGVVEYSNGGHNLPFIIKGQSKVEELKGTHGPALGAIDDVEYEQSQFTLSPSDTIYLYTDGVTEAINSQVEMFEVDRLKKALNESKLLSPKGITDTINKNLSAFVGDAEQADDITMLTLTYRG